MVKSFGYLKNIKTINTLWMINPTPIVITLSISFWTAALTNIKVNPVHINNIMSALGILSVSPAITANKLGMVAEWITITANQPKVSADTWATFSRTNVLTVSTLKSMIIPYKKYDDQFYQLLAYPNLD